MSFPVICFYGNLLRVRESFETLTTTTKAGLKNGYFRNMLVVDSEGQAIQIRDARKLHGVGPLWGYNIFLNQRIRVRLLIDTAPMHISLAEVKERVLESFRRWHGWSTRDDFEELKVSIVNASSIAEIIKQLFENESQDLRKRQ